MHSALSSLGPRLSRWLPCEGRGQFGPGVGGGAVLVPSVSQERAPGTSVPRPHQGLNPLWHLRVRS